MAESAERPVDVSVCIPSWNAAADLEPCLDALPAAAGTLRSQVVVVDNGSEDDTAKVLARHPNVNVIVNPTNVGITPARNQALHKAQGQVILMLDADTVPLPGSIETMVNYLDDHPRVGLVGARLLNPDGSLQESCRRMSTPVLPILRRPPFERRMANSRRINWHLMRDFDHDHARPVDWVMGACQCYRAHLLPALGVYDERVFSHGGEDLDWCLRVWKAGYEVHYVPQAEVIHRYGHFTRRHPLSKQSRRGVTDFYYVLWKHWDVRKGIAPH